MKHVSHANIVLPGGFEFAMLFNGKDGELGRLYEKDGKLYFEGDADESAQIFFRACEEAFGAFKKRE